MIDESPSTVGNVNVLGGQHNPRAQNRDWSTNPQTWLRTQTCSVVAQSPRSLNRRTSRPVPERIMLGGWYSPQAVVWADWSTSSRAYHDRWSVQSPGYQVCLTKKILLIFLKKSYRHINVRCDRASCHLVSLLHKKRGRRTVNPLIAGIKKGNQQLLKNGHQIYYGSS